MSNLHVIYRREPDGGWTTYSYPFGVYTVGATLEEARSRFREAAEFALDGLDDHRLVEHLEEPLVDGAFIRTAIDQHTLDRNEAAAIFRGSLAVATQAAEFRSTTPTGGSGDAVVVACVAGDRLSWLLEQMSDHDALAVCLAAPGPMVWWSFVAGPDSSVDPDTSESLADGGLDLDSTVSDLVRQQRAAPAGETPTASFRRGVLVGNR